MLVPEVKPGALSGTYVLEERSSKFFNMVSFGNPQSVGIKKRVVRQADRLNYTELPSLSNLDELLVRTRPPDMRPEEEVVVPVRAPPVDARLTIGSFRRLLRPGSNESRLEEETKDVPLQWHLLLLKASFNGKLQVSTAANWLVEVLNLAPEEARQCAQAAMVHPTVRIASFDDWKVVEEKVETLRALGLAIQVGSAATHRAIVNNRGAHQGRLAKDNYMELFDQVPGLIRSPRPSPTPPAKSHQHRAKWRGMSQHVVMDVLSKDPVKQLLPEEDEAAHFAGSQSEAEWNEWKLAKARKKTVKNILLKHPRKGDRNTAKSESDQDASDRTTLGVKTTFSFRNSVLETRKKMSMIVGLAQAQQNALTPQRKEACQMLRFFVFGAVGNEKAKTAEEKEAIFEQRLGERWQVQLLYNLWEKLDIDHSGRCDFGELNAFAELRLKDLVEQALSRGQRGLAGLPAWAADETEDVAKAALKLTRTLEQMLFASKSSFVLEDMMRILWPASQLSDILEMRRWCTEMADSLERTATQTPPLLPEDQLDDLHCIFQYFDTDHDGQLKVPDLIATGFLNRNEVDLIMQKYDVDGDEMLGLSEFTELLCPAGYRAHEKATHATLGNGRRVFYDDNFCRWRLAPNKR